MDLDWLFNTGVILFLAKGLGLTVAVAVVSGVIAFFAGSLLALGRLSSIWFLRALCVLFVEGVRSLPLLLIVFFVFFAMNTSLHLNMNPFTAGVVALSTFNAAVVAEIVRAGILSVDRGIVQAAQSQAFSSRQIFLMIQMPLALRRMTPALATQFISLLKSTSLLVVIGVPEFLSRAVVVTSNPPFSALPVYILVALTYFVVNYSLSLIAGRFEVSDSVGPRAA